MTEWMSAERPVWIAALILAAFFMMLSGTFSNLPEGTSKPFLGRISSTIEGVIFAVYLVLLVRYVRGPAKPPTFKPPYEERRLGVWGYVWRSWLLLWLSAFPIGAVSLLFSGDAAVQYSLSLIAALFVPALLCWILFGQDRIQFMKKVVSYFR